ncbi:hypothetical protein P4U57_27510, partial [Bacillus pseudomycoides]|uniref:hypothetical protein n=1 Tax=Bacillus pseudomycoides TaxID=64104 RepID=UPI002E1B957D|nr:hypothetical protein [Bacillus pseudomycoides]
SYSFPFQNQWLIIDIFDSNRYLRSFSMKYTKINKLIIGYSLIFVQRGHKASQSLRNIYKNAYCEVGQT